MDKQQILAELKEMSGRGEISQAEVMEALGNFSAPVSATRHFNISDILYYIGGGIVFLGVAVLIFQNWSYFDNTVKILVTLGISIATFVAAVLFSKYENLKKVSDAFFLISALLMPLGLYVTLDKTGLDVKLGLVNVFIYLILTAWYTASYMFFKRTILSFFVIVFGMGLFQSIISWMIGNNLSYENVTKVLEYRILASGLINMLLGYYFVGTAEEALTGILYGLGVMGFLGATIFLGGYQPNQNAFWELVYPLLVFGIIYLSVYLKSKAFLVFGTIFLIAYILKITGEYFTSGLGWPLALVLAGLVIMGVGYYAVRINKKYLTLSHV